LVNTEKERTVSNDPWSTLRKSSRTLLRNQIESEALYDARVALELHGPEAAADVLAAYAVPYSRVLEQERMDKEASA